MLNCFVVSVNVVAECLRVGSSLPCTHQHQALTVPCFGGCCCAAAVVQVSVFINMFVTCVFAAGFYGE